MIKTMTKEGLEKEAEEYATENYEQCMYDDVVGWKTDYEARKQAYLAGAEPREKRIANLEATNKKISDECHKLVDSLEKKQNENAELRTKLEALEGQTPWKDIRNKSELIKENAKLKEQNRNLLESCEGATMMYKDLCKAKELIKTLLLIADNKVSQMEFQLCVADAKQFLNSKVEKEKPEVQKREFPLSHRAQS